MKKLVILQTVVPDYRLNLFSFLHQNLGRSLGIFCGDHYFDRSVRTNERLPFLQKARNHYLFGRRILFQTGMWKEVLRADLLVMELNPRIASNWIILVMRKLFFKKTILWGHAWSRSGSNGKTEFLRGFMRKLSDELIVYTQSEKQQLEAKMKGKRISSAPNAIYSRDKMKPLPVNQDQITNLIFVGRLTKLKKPMILMESFLSVLDHIPADSRLIYVGDGDLKAGLKDQLAKVNVRQHSPDKLDERIQFTGHISDFNALSKLYARSLFSVSPGYAGLSLTQSLGFGVPALISKNEDHAPEIEAAKEGFNAVFYETDDVADLSSKIIEVFDKKDLWIKKREEISQDCRSSYSVESMAEPFLNLIKS